MLEQLTPALLQNAVGASTGMCKFMVKEWCENTPMARSELRDGIYAIPCVKIYTSRYIDPQQIRYCSSLLMASAAPEEIGCIRCTHKHYNVVRFSHMILTTL